MALAPSAVAMLPPMTCTCGKRCLIHCTRSSTACEWPCDVSTTSTSTPAWTSASTRSSVSPPVPTAAPTRRRPSSSFDASGCSVDLRMSLTVMRPRNSIASLTTSTRSSRCWCISALARSRSVPSGTVTSRSPLVMMLDAGWSRFVSNRRSRLVTMPTTRLPSTTGKPEIRCCRVSASTSRTDIVGGIVIGSLTTPLSKRLTFATSAACFAGGMFLCTTPSPPSCAMAMARRVSVTVSIAADSSGMLSPTLAVRRLFRLTSLGTTRECAGTSRTSSNVSAFRAARM